MFSTAVFTSSAVEVFDDGATTVFFTAIILFAVVVVGDGEGDEIEIEGSFGLKVFFGVVDNFLAATATVAAVVRDDAVVVVILFSGSGSPFRFKSQVLLHVTRF